MENVAGEQGLYLQMDTALIQILSLYERSLVSIYISRKNIPYHTIVGLCPPISTSGPSKNVSISAGSGFAGPTLPYLSISFWGEGGLFL